MNNPIVEWSEWSLYYLYLLFYKHQNSILSCRETDPNVWEVVIESQRTGYQSTVYLRPLILGQERK